MGAIAFFGDKYGDLGAGRAGRAALARVLRRHPRRLAGPDRADHAALRGLHRLQHAADLRRDRARRRSTGPSSASALVQSAAELLRTEPDELLAAIGRLLERQRDGREGAGAAAPAVERGRGPDAGRAGRGRRRGGRGPARQRRARRAAHAGPGGPAPRRGAGRRAGRLARRGEGGHRGGDRRDARRQRSWCARWAPMVGGGGGGSAEVALAGGKDPSQIDGGAGRGAAAPRPRERRGRGVRRRGPGRVAALDLGRPAHRRGRSATAAGTLASPWGTIERSGDPARDRAAVVDAVREVEASTVVVGLPLSLSGEVGPGGAGGARRGRGAARAARAARASRSRRPTSASRPWRPSAPCGRPAGRGKAARQVVDSAAAMVLLQAWLDNA